MYLEKINGPADVKALNSPERTVLAAEMRTALIQKLSRHGGHCGPNLGLVEAPLPCTRCLTPPRTDLSLMCLTRPIPTRCLPGAATAS